VAVSGLAIGCEEGADDEDDELGAAEVEQVETYMDEETEPVEGVAVDETPPPPSSAEYEEIDPSELAAGEAERPRTQAVDDPATLWAGGQVMNASWDVETEESDDEISKTLIIPNHAGDPALRVTRMQPATVRAGEPLEYRLTVRNVQDHPLRQVSLQEWRRGDLTVDRVSSDAGGTWEGSRSASSLSSSPGRYDASANRGGPAQGRAMNVASQQNQGTASRQAGGPTASSNHSEWNIGTLMPGESKTIAVRGVVSGEGEVSTCLTADFQPTVCVTTQVVKPQLRLARELSRPQALVCEEIEVLYTLENVGSGPTDAATIVEELPGGLETADGETTVRLDVGSLAPGEADEKVVRLTAVRSGEFASYAKANTQSLNVRSSEQQIQFVKPELQMTIDAPAEAFTGRAIPVRMSVSNVGDGPAPDTFIEIPNLRDLPRVSLSTQEVELDGDRLIIGLLDPGDSQDLTMTFQPETPGANSISATASAYCAETVSDTLNVNIRGVEAVRLEAIDLTDPVVVGDEVVYEISVKNQGTAESLNVRVKAQLPQEMAFVGGEGDSGVKASGQTVTMSPIDRLGPGDVATWRISANVESPGKTRLRVELKSDATQRAVTEQEPTTLLPKPPTER
jgi:uncharacterized repeat protein (TIGR01451 family)